ncbi:uncharacterized protein LOC120014657 [Tripterygium wilfordii]|nr:uncharacterized protein LOC120014657 [Tripterygium wilfordii]
MASSGIRMRMVRSSSQGEVGLLSHLRPWNSSFEKKKNPATIAKPVQRTVAESMPKVAKKEEQGQHQPCVFTIGSPERKKDDKGSKKNGFGDFFKNCCLCKKQLARDKHVFCYSDCSFCSPGCRDDWIALDGFDKEPITLTQPFADYVRTRQQQKNQKNSGWCPVKKWCTKVIVLSDKE